MDATKDRGRSSAAAHDNSEPRRAVGPSGPLSFTTDPDREPITAVYARALATCLLAERPDWQPHDIGAALDECRDQEPAKLRRAVFRLADTPGATPATLPLVGPHWEDDPKPKAAEPEAPVRMCPDHPTTPARECWTCKKKRKRPDWFEEKFQSEAAKDAQRRAQLKAEQDAADALRAAKADRI